MKQVFLAGAALLALTGCTTQGGGISLFTPAPETVEDALDSYYDTIPDSALPKAPAGMSLPASDAVLTKILLGSCLDEEKGPSAALMSLPAEEADLFLMVGDNVYGDRDGRAYVNNQPMLQTCIARLCGHSGLIVGSNNDDSQSGIRGSNCWVGCGSFSVT